MAALIVKRMFSLVIISIILSMLFEFNEYLALVWFGMFIICVTMYFVIYGSIRKVNYDKILNEKILKDVKTDVMSLEGKMLVWIVPIMFLWLLSWIIHENFELFNIGHSKIGNIYIYLNVIWMSFIFQLYFILYCIFNLRAIKKLQKEINRIK